MATCMPITRRGVLSAFPVAIAGGNVVPVAANPVPVPCVPQQSVELFSPALLYLLASPRAEIEAAIETLVECLDAMDGDPDLEPEVDCCSAHDDIGTGGEFARFLGDDGQPGDADDREEDNEDMCPAGDHGGRLTRPTYRPPMQILARPDQPEGNGHWVIAMPSGEVVLR
jgi:hypothetical protein